jgi:hypothetical protein
MDLDDVTRKAIGVAIKEHIARSGLSREEFCFQHKLPISTLNKIVTGVFTESGLAKLERKVGRTFRNRTGMMDRAADDLGGYLHVDQKHFIGHFTLVRNSFESAEKICLFPVKIDWDDSKPGLQLSSMANNEMKKSANISFPKGSPYLFVEANQKGWMSLMIFGTIDVDVVVRGVLLTTGSISAGAYTPFFMPVLLVRESTPHKKYSEIDRHDPRYKKLAGFLRDTITKQFVRLPTFVAQSSDVV